MAVLAVLLFFVYRPAGHQLTINTYFDDGEGLRDGAPVRLAGVDVGLVRSVRVRPDLRSSPVEVVMSLKTAAEMRIPNDCTAMLSTAGVLGETYVNIDCHRALGPPIQSGGTLNTAPTENQTTEQIISKFASVLNLNAEQTLEKLDTIVKGRCDCKCGAQAPAKKGTARKSQTN